MLAPLGRSCKAVGYSCIGDLPPWISGPRPRSPSINYRVKRLRFDRLGQIIVHSGGQTSFAITLHGMGRHRDDGYMLPGLLFALADRAAGLETVHFWHLYIHQYEVESLTSPRLQRLFASTHRLD